MSVEDYHRMFFATWINYDDEGLFRHSFLRLGDDGTGGKESDYFNNATTHTFTITSSEDQDIWVMMNTWDDRASPRSCLKDAGLRAIRSSWQRDYSMF